MRRRLAALLAALGVMALVASFPAYAATGAVASFTATASGKTATFNDTSYYLAALSASIVTVQETYRSWLFGDGQGAIGPAGNSTLTSHTYVANGTYNVTLLVQFLLSTGARVNATTSQSVAIGSPPAKPQPNICGFIVVGSILPAVWGAGLVHRRRSSRGR